MSEDSMLIKKSKMQGGLPQQYFENKGILGRNLTAFDSEVWMLDFCLKIQ